MALSSAANAAWRGTPKALWRSGLGGSLLASRPGSFLASADGTLGKVTICRTWIYSNQPQQGIGNLPGGGPPRGLDWDLLQAPAPAREFKPNRFGVYPDAYSYFRFFWDYAGDQLTGSGVDMLDIVHMALGEPMPRAVVALGGKY